MTITRAGFDKKEICLFLFLLVLCASSFAASTYTVAGLKTGLSAILGFFSSGYMKAILSIALGCLAVGMISSRGEPGMMKKFVPWIAACVILLSLSGITGIIFNGVTDVTTETTWN